MNKFHFRTIRGRMTVSFVAVFLIIIAFMGCSIYIFTGRLLEKKNEQSYIKILDATDEVLNDKVTSYAGVSRMILGDEKVQKILQTKDSGVGRIMEPSRWYGLEAIGSTYIYNLQDLVGIYIFDNDGKFYYQEPGKTSSEAELDADYEKISSADWYHQAEEAAGKEIMYGYDVLGNSENIISCVKILNKLNTSDKIGLLILQINKNTMRNVIGQFPTDGDIYVLKNQERIVYQNGYQEKLFQEKLEEILKNSENKYLITTLESAQDDWTLIHAVPRNSVFREAGQMRTIILIVAVAAVIFTVILCVTEARMITKPLLKLKEDIARVGRGKRSFYHSYGNDEVGVIGTEFQNMVMKELKLKEQISKEELLRKDSQLQLLQSQINPHFLYNSLSIINWMAIKSGQKEISKVTLDLSTFYRTALSKGEDMVTVENCIRNIEAYLSIQLVMHDNDFTVEWKIDPQVKAEKVPKLILQPVVENALEHGLDVKEEGDKILQLSFLDAGDAVLLRVEDNGMGMEQSVAESLVTYQAEGYGLKNVNDRICLLYGEEYKIRITSSVGKGTVVEMRIPKGETS